MPENIPPSGLPAEERGEALQLTRLRFEPLVLAALPLLGYFLIHQVQAGWCSYFGIPGNLILIDLTAILVATSYLLVALLILVPLGSVLTLLTFRHGKKVGPFTVYTHAAMVGATMIWILVMIASQLWWIIFRTLIAGAALALITLTSERFVTGYLRRRGRNISEIAAHLRPDLQTFIFSVAFFCLSLTWGAMNVGFFAAKSTTSYLILQTSPQLVILATYGDVMIAAPFDLSTRTVVEEFTFIRWKEQPGLVFAKREIGPLHPVPSRGESAP